MHVFGQWEVTGPVFLFVLVLLFFSSSLLGVARQVSVSRGSQVVELVDQLVSLTVWPISQSAARVNYKRSLQQSTL